MVTYSKIKQHLCLCIFLFYISIACGSLTPDTKIRAVNLGGWLVTEGWIKPSLFDGIPNKDLLDGTKLQFKSVTVGKYLCAETGGGAYIVSNRTYASGWETFTLWRISETTFQLRVFDGQFMGLDTAGNGNSIVAKAETPGKSETFEIVMYSSNPSLCRIKAPNGFFLQVKAENLVTADAQGGGNWQNTDPTVFNMTKVGGLQGDYQLTNGYGRVTASQVMKEHWNTFIVENDFRFISTNGLDAVRIPVGWWIASDPNPPWPYVEGSLQTLDNAFIWAKTYGVKVIIDLHAAPDSQNGFESSSTRDGQIKWGLSDQNIKQTVDVIDFLTSRYADHPSLYAVELINEPLYSGVSLDILMKYYTAGYNAVRKHSTAYVIMSNRLGLPEANARELFDLTNGLSKVVIDVHYYNVFSDVTNGWTVQQNIDFIYNNRSTELSQITTSNGPLTFVGEWVAEWKITGAGQTDYLNFANAQLKVYDQATFGWAYWGLKNQNHDWSLEWMIENHYIMLQ